jgi:RNase Y N-terminal region
MTMTRPPSTQVKPASPRSYKRTWVIAAGTAILALALGALVGTRAADATSSPEYQAQGARLATAESKLALAEAAMEDAQESQADAENTATDAQDQLAAFEGRLDERKAALKKRAATLKKREAAVDKRADRLKEKAADLTEREADVSAAEELLAETTVPGDGKFEVGVDIEGGLYKSAGKRACHFTVYGDAEGDDTLLDKSTAGPASVSLRAGTWFVTRGCAEWTRQ